jgi:hypothetical protein
MLTAHDIKGLIKFLERDKWGDCFEKVLDDHIGAVLDAGHSDGMPQEAEENVVSNVDCYPIFNECF